MSYQEVVAKPLDMGSDGELRGRRRDDLTDFLYQSLDYEQPEETEKSVATRTSLEGLQSKLKAKTNNLKQPQFDGGEIFHDNLINLYEKSSNRKTGKNHHLLQTQCLLFVNLSDCIKRTHAIH